MAFLRTRASPAMSSPASEKERRAEYQQVAGDAVAQLRRAHLTHKTVAIRVQAVAVDLPSWKLGECSWGEEQESGS